MEINIKEIEDACERVEKNMQQFEDQVRNEQEVHMEKMFEECGYSWREVLSMLRSGEMICHSRSTMFGFTGSITHTTYEFYTRGVLICMFFVHDYMAECADSKKGYGFSWNLISSYDYAIYKTREEIENEI